MNWANNVLKAIWDLFVDDAALAAQAVAWLALVRMLAALGFNPIWNCGLLFLGLSLILMRCTSRWTKSSRGR
jgi:hypothetical protein